ncbi:hypothetical protein B0H17DRAFT_1091696 [Mycena rosella]|uniref:Protein kinase domain-containing protein n=1 Tax=Mycena rosella TaxID=1033263 RepID=A0AAD7CVP4_MYCRO|nr:hypothetical protein B0H17DRAFT_1091696 [Mycena rosella]
MSESVRAVSPLCLPPAPFSLYDTDAVVEYHAKLEAARELALRNGLESGLSFVFDLVIPPANHLPGARNLPQFPAQSRPISLRLDQPLQSGPDKLSQVWTAVGEFPGANGEPQTTVVLKIIQPSMCRYPAVDDIWRDNYIFPEDFAVEEEWAYNHLADKQGLSIPYFFGLHTIITPSTESAWVLVLEYIPGQTLAAYLELPNKSYSDSCDILKRSIDTLTDFMAGGWAHGDLEPRNIVVAGSPGARTIVLVDIYSAIWLQPHQSRLEFPQQRRILYATIYSFLNDPDGEIQLWAEHNMDAEVWDPKRFCSLMATLDSW